MTAFDIGAAKRGEPVEHLTYAGEQWIPVHFVGIDMDGNPVVQRSRSGGMFSLPAHRTRLRMAPKKIKVRYRVACLMDSWGAPYIATASKEDSELDLVKDPHFKCWLTDWQEAEVEQ